MARSDLAYARTWAAEQLGSGTNGMVSVGLTRAWTIIMYPGLAPSSAADGGTDSAVPRERLHGNSSGSITWQSGFSKSATQVGVFSTIVRRTRRS